MQGGTPFKTWIQDFAPTKIHGLNKVRPLPYRVNLHIASGRRSKKQAGKPSRLAPPGYSGSTVY